MKRLLIGLGTLLGLMLTLAGCSGNADMPLPLAEGQPTLLFFYTDN